MRLQASATPIRQHSTVMQIGTDDVYNCEVQPDKTTFQTVEVVDVELEYEADSCGRVASNVGTLAAWSGAQIYAFSFLTDMEFDVMRSEEGHCTGSVDRPSANTG